MKISWVFDVISPFSYLGLKQLERLPPEVEIELVPVLFAGLLNHHGQIGNAEIESKRRFTYRFCLWRARALGIPMRVPPTHPFNPLSALRLIIAAGCSRRAVETVFDAVFLHGRDVADPAVIADLARQLDITDVAAALANPSVKQQLHDNTNWAIAHGVFGVPTFVVEGELFWGHESLEMLLDYLRHPASFGDPQMRRIDTLPIGVQRQRKQHAPMLHHVSLGVSDLGRAASFYDAVLAALGYVRVWADDTAIGYGYPGGGDKLAIKLREGGTAPSDGFHLAFSAPTRAAVQAFHAAALNHGGRDNGTPGLRSEYGPTYYAAFAIDPDGHRVEAVDKSTA